MTKLIPFTCLFADSVVQTFYHNLPYYGRHTTLSHVLLSYRLSLNFVTMQELRDDPRNEDNAYLTF